MRKKLMGFLLVPVLLLAIVSCDDNIFGTISDFMGQAGANVYVDGGLVQVDTSQGETVSNALAELPTGAIPDPDTETEAYDTYVADYQEQVDIMKEEFTEALVSETKTQALVEAMSQPLADGTPVPPLAQQAVDDIQTGLGITIDTSTLETEGDLAALVLIAQLYQNASEAIGDGSVPLTDEQALELVSEAQQVIEIIQTISPTGAVTLDEILGELIGDQAILDQLFRGTARSTAREGEDDFDPSTILEPIFNTIINAIGTTTDPDTGIRTINQTGLDRMKMNFSLMRIAYEQVAPNLPSLDVLIASGQALELTDVINYALSVVFTEADGLLATLTSPITFKAAIDDVIAWIDAGKPETGPAILANIEWATEFDEFMSDVANEAKFGETGTVITTIKQLAAAVPDGGFIITAIDNFFADQTT